MIISGSSRVTLVDDLSVFAPKFWEFLLASTARVAIMESVHNIIFLPVISLISIFSHSITVRYDIIRLFTARKWSCWRLCFYTCLSVFLFTAQSPPPLWADLGGWTDSPRQTPLDVDPPGRLPWMQNPPPRCRPPPPEIHQQAGGMQPIALHTCWRIFSHYFFTKN